MKTLLLLLGLCMVVRADHCVTAKIVAQNVVVPVVQQIVAVPVQPYYFSYGQQVSTGNNQAIKAPTESQYLTKQEFLEAMKLVLAESRGDTQYIVENNPEEAKLKELVKTKCVTCHQTSPVNWKNSNVQVSFFDPNGKWDQNINWDRMVTVTIGGKMPKGGPRLNGDEVTLFVKKAEMVADTPLPPVPQQQQAPPVPQQPAGNY